jgi:hypothetical protein
VWDRRGAYGNVNYGLVYTGTYRGNAETAKAGPTVARVVFLSQPRPRFALHGAQRLTVESWRPVLDEIPAAVGDAQLWVASHHDALVLDRFLSVRLWGYFWVCPRNILNGRVFCA